MMTKIAGLTGGIASGKSTATDIFVKLGARIVDADLLARDVVRPGRWAWKRIVSHFGPEILQEDEQIDRKKLGDIIFKTPSERHFLNRVTHPPIYYQTLRALASHVIRHPPLIIIDAPLLIETPLRRITRTIIVVYVDPETQLQRLVNRDGITRQEALLRIQSQMPLEEKRRMANHVIDNSDTIAETEEQIVQLWERLSRPRDRRRIFTRHI